VVCRTESTEEHLANASADDDGDDPPNVEHHNSQPGTSARLRNSLVRSREVTQTGGKRKQTHMRRYRISVCRAWINPLGTSTPIRKGRLHLPSLAGSIRRLQAFGKWLCVDSSVTWPATFSRSTFSRSPSWSDEEDDPEAVYSGAANARGVSGAEEGSPIDE
jgi:hypothetical protein